MIIVLYIRTLDIYFNKKRRPWQGHTRDGSCNTPVQAQYLLYRSWLSAYCALAMYLHTRPILGAAAARSSEGKGSAVRHYHRRQNHHHLAGALLAFSPKTTPTTVRQRTNEYYEPNIRSRRCIVLVLAHRQHSSTLVPDPARAS